MLAEQYQVLEVWFPYYRLKEAGIDCDFVAAEANKDYPSKEGYPCRSTVAAKNAKVADYDCMLVPGGFAPDFMRRSDDMIKFANDMVEGRTKLSPLYATGRGCYAAPKFSKAKRRPALCPSATTSKTPAQTTSMRNVSSTATSLPPENPMTCPPSAGQS